ncbi:hypothetical protein TRFO_17398 [Tritrichomonas foetus]|uniref:Myb-like DNA-binding domain containing protein n=1 Tax=Tritrichomonas foetus TaxID=1144522 RepID=A0A1J4KNI6_9EUKA|nr:hypothetical protein TRFO_17398 [Tritrichomonas foetus]|eukprot:OHT12690.1 hypothetical protein TRFO_17398 [Tritrichomonas foetus]
MDPHLQAICEFIFKEFHDRKIFRNSTASSKLKRIIEQFILKEITYEKCKEVVTKIAKTTKPISRLHTIINMITAPIPFYDNDSRSSINGSPETNCPGNKANVPGNHSSAKKLINRKNRQWTTNEDNRLLAGIYFYGLNNWKAIAHFVGNERTRSQCSQRWLRGLNPLVTKSPWTHLEDMNLLKLVETHGAKKWIYISSQIGNRSDVQCRYRYMNLMKMNEYSYNSNTINLKKPLEINTSTISREKNNDLYSKGKNKITSLSSTINNDFYDSKKLQRPNLSTSVLTNDFSPMNSHNNQTMNSQIYAQFNNPINNQVNNHMNTKYNHIHLNYQGNSMTQLQYLLNQNQNIPISQQSNGNIFNPFSYQGQSPPVIYNSHLNQVSGLVANCQSYQIQAPLVHQNNEENSSPYPTPKIQEVHTHVENNVSQSTTDLSSESFQHESLESTKIQQVELLSNPSSDDIFDFDYFLKRDSDFCFASGI